MAFMKKRCFIVLLSFLLILCPICVSPAETGGQKSMGFREARAEEAAVYVPMPEPGKRVVIGNGYYLIYGFDKKPKLGTVIMKVEIFTAEGRTDTSFMVKADADMPSMRGAHDTGDRPFVVSKRGDYVLPINIVMPGAWEVKLTVTKDGRIIYRGRHDFNV